MLKEEGIGSGSVTNYNGFEFRNFKGNKSGKPKN
jgi:hypothetical protein